LSLLTTRRQHRDEKQQTNKLYSQLTDAIFGQVDWQASGRTDEILKRLEEEDRLLVKTENNLRKWKHVRNALLRLIIGFVIVLMIIWADKQTGQRAFSPTVIAAFVRSEEHTSELQSRFDIVCRLLLENIKDYMY